SPPPLPSATRTPCTPPAFAATPEGPSEAEPAEELPRGADPATQRATAIRRARDTTAPGRRARLLLGQLEADGRHGARLQMDVARLRLKARRAHPQAIVAFVERRSDVAVRR